MSEDCHNSKDCHYPSDDEKFWKEIQLGTHASDQLIMYMKDFIMPILKAIKDGAIENGFTEKESMEMVYMYWQGICNAFRR